MRKTTLFVAVIVSFILTLPCIVGAAEWNPYGLNIVSNYDNNRTNDRNYKDFIFDVSEDNFYYLSFMSHIPDLDNPQYRSFDISIDGENSWYADAVGSGWTQFVVSSWEPIWLATGTKKIGEEPYGQNGECGKRNNFFGYGLLNIFNSLKIFPTSLGEDDTVGL